MCFSATGSFAISGVLTAVGAASVARNSARPLRMFAAIPLIFAFQQAAEGSVWLTMDGVHAAVHRLAVNGFLSIALLVWPTWMPFALKLAERDPGRRRALAALSWMGVAVAICAAVWLVRFNPTAEVAGHSIRYRYSPNASDAEALLYLLVYAVPAVAPFFVSTVRLSPTIGVMLIVSLIAATIVEKDALASVWCFFAAMLSVLVLVAVEREGRVHARPIPLGS